MERADRLNSDAPTELSKPRLFTDAGNQLMETFELFNQIRDISSKNLRFDEKPPFVADLKKEEAKEGSYKDGKPIATSPFINRHFVKFPTREMMPHIDTILSRLKD